MECVESMESEIAQGMYESPLSAASELIDLRQDLFASRHALAKRKRDSALRSAQEISRAVLREYVAHYHIAQRLNAADVFEEAFMEYVYQKMGVSSLDLTALSKKKSDLEQKVIALADVNESQEAAYSTSAEVHSASEVTGFVAGAATLAGSAMGGSYLFHLLKPEPHMDIVNSFVGGGLGLIVGGYVGVFAFNVVGCISEFVYGGIGKYFFERAKQKKRKLISERDVCAANLKTMEEKRRALDLAFSEGRIEDIVEKAGAIDYEEIVKIQYKPSL